MPIPKAAGKLEQLSASEKMAKKCRWTSLGNYRKLGIARSLVALVLDLTENDLRDLGTSKAAPYLVILMVLNSMKVINWLNP